MPLPLHVRYYGKEQPLPEQIPLRAGPLSLVYEAGCLRRIRLGEQEIMRRVYVAIRDQNWGTAPDELSNVEMEIGADAFHIRYDVSNRLHDVDFVWRGEITGEADGTIHFRMDGEARADFLRSRIGFCVLPPMTCAGHQARITHVDGTEDASAFPQTIAPQLVVDGKIKPVSPFEEMQSLAYEAAPGLWAILAFEGDIFEMEDQRNWTDASYKIYSTPLRLPFPVQVRRGDRVRQSITLRLEGQLPESSGADEAVPEVIIGAEARHALPALGLAMASHGNLLSERETARLKSLRLAHLRLDLDLASPAFAQRFLQACAEAAALETALEVALFVDEESIGELDVLFDILRDAQPRIARWIVFDGGGKTSPPKLVSEAWAVLSAYDGRVPVGGGTNGFFTDLNRDRPDVSALDFVVYSLNPQVHAFDNDSLMETPATQAVTVHSAASLADGKPVVVSPVTLLPRRNPHAAGHVPQLAPGELPPQVDVRQMSLFGAVWTVGSLKYLAESDAASVTYFETTGWCGVMETEAGSPVPERFPSTPGGVFPMYHVFADMADFADGQVLPAESTQPLRVDALAIHHGDGVRVLVANLRPQSQKAIVRGLPAQVAVSALDEESFEEAVTSPDQFRARPPQIVDTDSGALEWTLPPYSVLRIDFS